jgi:hypothetical protein
MPGRPAPGKNDDRGDLTNMLKKIALITFSIGAVLGLGYVITLVAVKPVSTDLSVVGQGRPALVLAYENFSPTGGEALERLRAIRADYEDRLDIVVADLGTPQGKVFANRHRLVDGQAVFLRPDGRPLQVTGIPAEERELRARLDMKLAAVE